MNIPLVQYFIFERELCQVRDIVEDILAPNNGPLALLLGIKTERSTLNFKLKSTIRDGKVSQSKYVRFEVDASVRLKSSTGPRERTKKCDEQRE